MDIKYETKVTISPGGLIEQTIEEVTQRGDKIARKVFTRNYLCTKDPLVHNALITLGWTPPKED